MNELLLNKAEYFYKAKLDYYIKFISLHRAIIVVGNITK